MNNVQLAYNAFSEFNFPGLMNDFEKDGADSQSKNEIEAKIQSTNTCTEAQFQRANQVKNIHNVIEEIAYRAFAEKVVGLHLTQDNITAEQSGQILNYIKCEAHKELYKNGGYATERFKLLEPCQVKKIIANVAKIVHDRDTKLTNATYYSLSELLLGLDDHNTMVKEILLESWYQCGRIDDCKHSHLQKIKDKINFYETLNNQLNFDLKDKLKDRQQFWETYFPGVREDNKYSEKFMNIMEVRHCFVGVQPEYDSTLDYLKFGTNEVSYMVLPNELDNELKSFLQESDIKALFEKGAAVNQVRGCNLERSALLQDDKMTVRQFITSYFPEVKLPE